MQILSLQLLFVLLEQRVLLRELGVLGLELLVALLQDFVVTPQLFFHFALSLRVDERGTDGRQHHQHRDASHRERHAYGIDD